MNSKEGEFSIEFASPLRTKLEALQEFVTENDLMGVLDRRYILQWLSALDDMQVTRLKATVVRAKRVETWSLRMTINDKKDFEGKGPNFEEAIITLCEDLEIYATTAAAS